MSRRKSRRPSSGKTRKSQSYNNHTQAATRHETEYFEVPKSLSYQKPFIQYWDNPEDDNDLLALFGGFGTGKTEQLIKKGVRESQKQSLRVGLFGVSFERHIQDVNLERFKKYYPQESAIFNKHSIHFHNSTWQLYGLGKRGATDAFASEEFDFILIDEASLIPIENIQFLLTRQRKKGRFLKFILCGIAPDLGSPLHRFIQDMNFKIFQWSTYDNDLLDERYIERMENLYPEGAARDKYLRGQFVATGYAVFPYEFMRFGKPNGMKYVVAFIDPAISEKGDEFVIGVQGLGPDGMVYNLDCIHKRGVHINQQYELARAVNQRWQPDIFAMETNAYQEAGAQQFRLNGLKDLRSIVTTKDKVTNALKYSGAWGNGMIHWAFKDQEVIDQHLSFPNEKHDDIVDAFSGCYNLLDKLMSRNEEPTRPPVRSSIKLSRK